ncbi:polyprenyl diphosphate synthase [Abyssibacter sp.]|uniref:polyprenyl diphosphate synthase n=1 Tax=Abyssibacter sp. TaxID=2320200 RepID=UPI0025BEEFD4|nr:polyprenyl diphosphate synthase [Abyssibacter sp.]MCK5857928.1 di-trans,poly-cis-decaprenylcistransferase [Abyssibacter sp.]
MSIPQHVAVIMDGNGRWARRRGQPRAAGHRAGVRALRALVEQAIRSKVGYLTVFAFSSENWARPIQEVRLLMELFMKALDREVAELHENGVRLRFIGDHGRLAPALRERMAQAEDQTAGNTRMQLAIAVGYGGRDDLTRAARRMAQDVALGQLSPADIDEECLGRYRDLADWPDPDLFIRTGGDQRVSNFLLWDLAYTELYFSPVLWPDFDGQSLLDALDWFGDRERRFGGLAEVSR